LFTDGRLNAVVSVIAIQRLGQRRGRILRVPFYQVYPNAPVGRRAAAALAVMPLGQDDRIGFVFSNAGEGG